jgi:hypothetical protein
MNGLTYLTLFALNNNIKYMVNKCLNILKNKMKKFLICIALWKKEVILIIYSLSLGKKS